MRWDNATAVAVGVLTKSSTRGADMKAFLENVYSFRKPTRHSIDRDRHAVLLAADREQGGGHVDCRPERKP